MKRAENDNWLDDALAKVIGSEKSTADFEKWKQDHPGAVEMLTSRAQQPSAARPHSLRILTIMKNPITKLAAAAVIIIGVFLGIHHFTGSIDGATVAWADVRAAFLAHPWVHLKYDNGKEQWISLQEGKFYYKNVDGWKAFVDGVLNIRQVYSPELGEHISEDRPTIYPGGVIPPWQPKTAWEIVVGHLEEMSGKVVGDRWEVQKEIEQPDNKKLVRFDVYYYDAIGRRLLIKRLWADPETRLPVRIWERLSLAEREEQKREFITGEFDFPVTGPSSIYDLGVSKELSIVKDYDRIAEPSIEKIVKAGTAALARFPDRYRTLTWPAGGNDTIEVVYRNGEKIHHNHYFNLVGLPDYSLKKGAIAEEVLEWTQTQVPVNVAIFDGSRSYIRSNPHPSSSFKDRQEPKVRILKEKSVYVSSEPHKELWPYASIDAAGRFRWIDDKPDELSNYVGIKTERGDIQRDFYIDPERDYICVRWIWWKQRAGTWEKEREYGCSDFVELPEGQWYPRKRVLITYPDPEKGTVRNQVDWNIDIKPLEENEYPLDTFNGEKLLEGAKIETY